MSTNKLAAFLLFASSLCAAQIINPGATPAGTQGEPLVNTTGSNIYATSGYQIDAAQLSGSDACAKMTAGMSALSSRSYHSGQINARALRGSQSCAVQPFDGIAFNGYSPSVTGTLLLPEGVISTCESWWEPTGWTVEGEGPSLGPNQVGTVIQANPACFLPTYSDTTDSSSVTTATCGGTPFTCVITGTGTHFLTKTQKHMAFGLCTATTTGPACGANNAPNIMNGVVSSISSDTSLTITTNAAYTGSPTGPFSFAFWNPGFMLGDMSGSSANPANLGVVAKNLRFDCNGVAGCGGFGNFSAQNLSHYENIAVNPGPHGTAFDNEGPKQQNSGPNGASWSVGKAGQCDTGTIGFFYRGTAASPLVFQSVSIDTAQCSGLGPASGSGSLISDGINLDIIGLHILDNAVGTQTGNAVDIGDSINAAVMSIYPAQTASGNVIDNVNCQTSGLNCVKLGTGAIDARIGPVAIGASPVTNFVNLITNANDSCVIPAGNSAGVSEPNIGFYITDHLGATKYSTSKVPACNPLLGVAVEASNPATLLSTDRVSYVPWTSGSTLTLPAISGLFGSNFPFVLKNTAGATLALTPTTPNNIDGGSSQAVSNVLNNWAAFTYSDTAGPNWFTIKVPTFAAFGTTCANALTWSTTTGFGCSGALGGSAFPLTVSGTVTSGGIPYFTSTTGEASSAILNANILVKGGGAGTAPTNSSVSDNGTIISASEGISLSPTSTSQQAAVFNNPTSTSVDIADFKTNAVTQVAIGNGGVISTGTPPAIGTPGTGAIFAGAEGTEPGSVTGDAFAMDSTSHCPIVWANSLNVGCVAALGQTQTFSAANKFTSTLGVIGPIQSTNANTALVITGGINAATTGAAGTLAAGGENVSGGSTASIAGGAATFAGGDNASSGATETAGAVTLRGGDTTNASAAANTPGAVTIRGGNTSSTGSSTAAPVTITGGTISGAATNIVGADVTIAGGLGRGNATPSHVKLQAPGFSSTSGTAAQAQATTYVVHKKAGSTTSATATNMFNIPVAVNQTIGVEIVVHVETTQATPQNCSTTENFIAAVQNTASTITSQTSAGTIATICSTGTLTLAVAFSSATPSVLSVTPSWTTVVPTAVIITVEIHNLSQQDVTLL